MKNPHVLRGYACASGGAIIWGLSGTAGQYLLSHYDAGPLLISNLRLLIGGRFIISLCRAPTPGYTTAPTPSKRLGTAGLLCHFRVTHESNSLLYHH